MPVRRCRQASCLHDIGEHAKPAAAGTRVVGEAGGDLVCWFVCRTVLITVPADPDRERIKPLEHRLAAAHAACTRAQAPHRCIVIGIPQGKDPCRPNPHLEDTVLVSPPALVCVARRVTVAAAPRPGSPALSTHCCQTTPPLPLLSKGRGTCANAPLQHFPRHVPCTGPARLHCTCRHKLHELPTGRLIDKS